MSHKRPSVPGDAPLPTLPQPLPYAILRGFATQTTTLPEAEDRHEQIQKAREKVSAAIDLIDLAIRQNHADFLAQRPCWSYDTRIQIEERLKAFRRQRQTLQELFGQCNRQRKRLLADRMPSHADTGTFDRAFLHAARALLTQETVEMLEAHARDMLQREQVVGEAEP